MGRIEDIEARLKARIGAMSRRLGDRMTAMDARLNGDVSDVVNSLEDTLEAWLQPDVADIRPLFDYVRSSRVVQDNPGYSNALANVDLVYLTNPAESKSNEVNAGAIASGGRFKIAICAGLARQARIAGTALASKDAVVTFKRLLKIVDGEPGWAASISMQEAKKLFSALGLSLDRILADEAMRQEAVARSSAAILATLAHEAGHIVLGHVNADVDYYKVNLEVARMQERQADSFMSSVISTVPFGEHMFEAELFFDYLNAVAEKAESNDSQRTHPLSIERYNNLLKDHPDLAVRYDLKPLNAISDDKA